jgi:Fic family protein
MPGKLLQQVWQSDPTINAPAKYRRACRYQAFLPVTVSTLDVSLSAGLGGVVSEAELAIRALNDQPVGALKPLARLLLRTESIASSKVEGLQVGARQLARAEARAAEGASASSTAAEVLANIDAMVVAIDEATSARRFGVNDIVAIHRRLMASAPNRKVSGKVRTVQNWIGGNDFTPCGADFVPPPPENVAELLDDVCDAINDDLLPPVVQAALVHAQFETIHPFDDGNGRTGRALIHVVFRRRGLAPHFLPPISVVLARARARYVASLTNYRGDDVANWIEYFAASSLRAAGLATAYLAAVRKLVAKWRAQLADAPRAPRSDAAAWAIIDILPAHPIVSAGVLVAETGRAKPAVYQGIEQLVAAGVLAPVSTSKRNRLWEARGLLSLVERMEAGESE